jgi:seryl-tRNA synthetase
MRMLDMKWIRSHQDQVLYAVGNKGIELSLDRLLQVDEERRELRNEADVIRAEQNKLSKQVAALMKSSLHNEAEIKKQEVRTKQALLMQLENQLEHVGHEFAELMLKVPNIISEDTPIGLTDADNVVVEHFGAPPEFPFAALDHVVLGESLGMLDIPRGVKVAGTRNYYLKGMGLYLHRAVQQLAIDVLADRGFTVMDVPIMAKESALKNTGFFPAGKDQTYGIADEDKWLVGTSEVPLISYHADEVVDLRGGPIRLGAVSNCFRQEAGSAGRDVRGLYRVHQFAKVEQVIICQNNLDVAEAMLSEITENAETILQLLELPYRKVAVCSGDMGLKNYKQYDLETWMPSRAAYGETHSSSSLLDFQARRSGIRYKDDESRLQYGCTLNCTAVATPRILIPLMENHQQADGSIYVPKALRPYMRGMEKIELLKA